MMAISIISYFASRRRKSPRRRRLRSPPAASEDSSEKSLFFVAINDKLERYCYKSNPWQIEKTGRKKRKRCCTCSNYQQRPEQHECNRRRITALEPIRDGTFGFRVNVRSTYVALGSTIYCLGGYLSAQSWTRQDTVLCFDTTCPGWKLCRSMIRCRVKPVAVAIDGKLYVFGGLPLRGSYNFDDYKDHEDEHKNDDDGEDWLPWGEVFDPNTNTWEALPDPPIHLEDSISALVVDEDQGGRKKTVVVLASKYGKLYGYNVLTSSWDLLFMDQSFRFQNLKYREVGGPAVVSDKTLYWYSQTSREHKIEAYDLEKRMWFTGLFKGLEWDGLVTPPGDPSDHTHYSSPKLLHLEDQDLWCLVWEDHRAYKDSKKWYTCIDFVKFRVTKRINSRKGKGVLDIQIESSRIHLIYPSLCFEYAFLL